MRGRKAAQTNFICLVNVEDRIPKGHPIREVKRMIGEVFRRLDPEFEDLYSQQGRASIPPERLLGAKVLMALYTVRSDRQFCERLKYDLLFQWFLDLNPDEESFDASTFSKNQERLLRHHVSELFFAAVVEIAREKKWESNEHFSADGIASSPVKVPKTRGLPPAMLPWIFSLPRSKPAAWMLSTSRDFIGFGLW